MITPQQQIHLHRFRAGKWEPLSAGTIVEAPVSLTVNGEPWITFMCTPTELEALAIGFLHNEGILGTMTDVADVRVCEHGDNVDVWLTHAAERPSSWRRTSGCTGGVTAVDLLALPEVALDPGNPVLEPGAIGHLVEQLFGAQTLYRETGGVHTSMMSDGEGLVLTAEDIGRHNTLDKIAGQCVLGGLWPTTRIVITTGRISSEMLQKAARLRVPVLISRTSPSSLSIEMAERYGITLIGYARRQGFNVYSHPQRVGQ
ncbi:MAG TPA: formate dehydrogenase accessory sulfurtransferase FdhD [Anaerolineales bacterium]|nr:formate dehydrogenase accessory sulfurtransferase FdhD [Anaerolineales bacterium]